MKAYIARGMAALATLAAYNASAQAPQNQDDEAIEEVIVTATKRAVSLQEVPFSVAALTSDDITEQGATNLVEVARSVPGLYIADLGPGQSQVAIRGISAGQVVRDQAGVKESVGIYLDESPISVALFTPDIDLYDLDRLEVLRGPQGTLFGAGSTSGTVRYITAQPKIGKFGGSMDATLTSGTDSELGGALKGMINVPLGESAAMRAVVYHNELAGFIDSVYPNRLRIEDVNSGTRSGGRIAFRFEPNDTVSFTPRLIYQKLETDGYPRADEWNILGNPFTTSQTAVDPGERGQVTQIREGIDDEFLLADLKMEFGFGDIGLTSVTSFTDRDVVVLRDASQLTGSVTVDLGGTAAEARFNSPLYDTTNLRVLSQEFRIASTGEGPLQWLTGVFYQKVDREYGQNLPTPGYDAMTQRLLGVDSADFNAPPDTPYFSDLNYDFKQLAAFGEATFQFNSQWSLTGGLRYYDFDEDRTLTFAGLFADQGYTDQPGTTSSDGLSPRVILAFAPNKDIQFTAQASRGFRLGGINDPLNITLCQGNDATTYGGRETWDDEIVNNFELGTKTRFNGGRVVFNASLFMTEIDDLQVIADAGSCSSRIILNADAQTRGAEFELYLRPDEHFDFGLSATYADTEITESLINPDSGLPIAGIREGNRLPTSPELQAAATLAYQWNWSSRFESYVRLTVQHVGSSYTQLADQEPNFGHLMPAPPGPPTAPNPPDPLFGSARLIDYGDLSIGSFDFDAELPSYQIGNIRFGLRTDRWEGGVFINNLWDERALLSIDRERGRSARVGYLTNPPRTFGVNFHVNF